MSKPADTEIAAAVRAALARKMVSQRQLASHISITETALSRRLRGKVPFLASELAAVAEYLDISQAELTARSHKAAS